MNTIDMAVGPWVFDARVAGPDDGEVVLLLHGFPQTSLTWQDQLPALAAAGFRAIAPDQRGYSPRARPSDVADYASSALVGDVIGMLDTLGVDRCHLVGHDWGGAVAWQVAGRHADRLRSLTVVSTPHPAAFRRALHGELGGDQAERSGYIAMFREPGSEDLLLADDAALFRQLFDASGMPAGRGLPYIEALSSREALGAALNWYRAADLTLIEGLQPITTPTMYVWSTGDLALGREPAEATAGFIEGPYRFEELEGVSHWVTDEVPERFNELLIDHIRSV